jgi:hypothetical protein
MPKHTRLIASFGVIASAAWLAAQFPVNTELYGGGTVGSVRYGGNPVGTSWLLPSEFRQAILSSGALPSDVRAQMAAVGPIPPEGPAAYIPPPPSYQSSTFNRGTVRYPGGSSMMPNPMLMGSRSLTAPPLNSPSLAPPPL